MQPRHQHILRTTPISRRLLVLCAALMVLAQAFLAVHAVHHLASGDTGSCQVCLLGGGMDQAAVDIPGPVLAVSPAAPDVSVPSPSHSSNQLYSFRQRAPPHSPSV